MKDFFSNMNFPRGVIVVMLLASCVLGYFVYARSSRLVEVRSELARTPQLVVDIQETALQLNELQGRQEKDSLGEVEDAELYIQSIAQSPACLIGQVEITPIRPTSTREYEDVKFKIKPLKKTQQLGRSNIANFLYKLEAGSPRVRVSHFKISPFNKLKPGEIGDDIWTFEAEITSRRVLEQQ